MLPKGTTPTRSLETCQARSTVSAAATKLAAIAAHGGHYIVDESAELRPLAVCVEGAHQRAAGQVADHGQVVAGGMIVALTGVSTFLLRPSNRMLRRCWVRAWHRKAL